MTSRRTGSDHDTFELVLAGDVMTGRGIDQILPRPSSPELFESHLHDARDYVALAEELSGPIPRPVTVEYPWGEALPELHRADVRIVNLETSITRSDDAWPDKGINYRMNPENVSCLTAARIDVAVLANNHVLDWGRAGLVETLDTLRAAGVTTVGAGRNATDAEAIAVTELDECRRVLVAAIAEPGCGAPLAWAATSERPGIALFRKLDERAADALAKRVQAVRRPRDLVVVSIHWGTNWGYDVEEEQIAFAHALVERDVDVVFGHSSHHPRPIEIVRGRPILYGCGDLISDYEGISGYESFRNDLCLLYVLRCADDPSSTPPVAARAGRVASSSARIELTMKPFRMRKMRLERASAEDRRWVMERLAQVSRPFGTAIVMRADLSLEARACRDDA